MKKNKDASVTEDNLTPERILSGWLPFTNNLSKLNVEQLEELLQKEASGLCRAAYVKRIHARLSKLKSRKQIEEILSIKKDRG